MLRVYTSPSFLGDNVDASHRKNRYSSRMIHLRHSAQSGFSVIEIAVVLIIFGGIAAMSITLGHQWLKQERYTATRLNIETIEEALDSYRKRNRRLPCPGDITISRGDTDFGVEADNDGACTGGALQAAVTTSANIVYGSIPVETLNLSRGLMYDSWGRAFVYYVDIRLTAEDSLDNREAGYYDMDAAVGDITIEDATGANRTTTAVYAIVSHGENGHGGYKYDGTRQDFGSGFSNAEVENCNCNDAAVTTGVAPYDDDNVLVQQLVSRVFDDIVHYKARSQLFNKTQPD